MPPSQRASVRHASQRASAHTSQAGKKAKSKNTSKEAGEAPSNEAAEAASAASLLSEVMEGSKPPRPLDRRSSAGTMDPSTFQARRTSAAAMRVEAALPWTQKAVGLFDRIDVDGSGMIDKEELMSKLQADGQLEELLGAKAFGLDDSMGSIGAAASAGEPKQDAREVRARARAERRSRLIAMLIDEFDKTKNNMLNRDEFSEMIRLGRIRVLFHRMDTDGSGFIEKAELAAKLQADGELEELLGVPKVSGVKVYTSMLYVNLYNQFDDNKDGKLSCAEFERLCTEATAQARAEALKQAEVAKASAATLAAPAAEATAVEAS